LYIAAGFSSAKEIRVCPKTFQPRLCRGFQDAGRRENAQDSDATAKPLQEHLIQKTAISDGHRTIAREA